MKIKKLVVASVCSVGLIATAYGIGRLTDDGEAQADTPKIQVNPGVLSTGCPATLKFKAQIDPADAGPWSGERLNFEGTSKFEKVFVNGGNQVRCHYTPDNASGFGPSVINKFTGKTCTAAADHKSFTCK